MSHGSVLPQENDYLYKTRKKRQSRSGESENNAMASTCLHDNKKRKSDPPRVARLVRTTKRVTRSINKEHITGIKERDTKKWICLR